MLQCALCSFKQSQQATIAHRAVWHAQRIAGELFLFMDLCGSLLSSLRL